MNELKRIVDLRQSGLTWKQIDELIYPQLPVRSKGRTYSGDLAVKNKAICPGAFTKRVYGAYTNHQIVETLRPRVVPMVAA